jgi:cytochrome c oxidase subunit 4
MTPLNPPLVAPRVYVGVWVVLLALLLLNWGLAQFDLGPFNLVATLSIAFVQMLLMLLYLMHVRYNTALTRVFVVAGFVWLLIMVDLTLSDYLTRGASGRELQPHASTPFAPPPPSMQPPLNR